MNGERHERTIGLIKRARNGEKEARDALVEENMGLVRHLVNRFLDRGKEYEDLFQYGCMGLLKAIDRFDMGFDTAFSTYAVPVILGEIRRYLRDDGTVHVARSIRENAVRIEKFRKEYWNRYGNDPTMEETCTATGLKRNDFLLAFQALNPVKSLDAPLEDGTNTCLGDTVGCEAMEKVERKLLLQGMLGGLREDERSLIVKRYFFDKTQTQLAHEMGISQVQVSRMESRILKKMRASAEAGA